MQVLTNSEQITNWKSTLSNKVVYVPTMGALHEGHFSLVKKAKELNERVIVSIFVNPLQFNNAADLEKYPRTEEEDLKALEELGVDAVFLPTEEVMYPKEITLPEFELGRLDEVLEGEHRPGHFQGVAKVVYRLFDLIKPDFAIFGQKDLQQVAVIKTMVQQTDIQVELITAPTIRASNGLALSSRNRRLSENGYKQAVSIYHALEHARKTVQNLSFEEVERMARRSLEKDGLEVEYVKSVNPETFENPSAEKDEHTFLCIAAYLEGVRLIDNMQLIA